MASQGGLTVAVIGRSRPDESALSAAHVAVAMPSPGASGEWAVMLASDDVRDGALAISLARRTKSQARAGLVLALFAFRSFFRFLAVFGLLAPGVRTFGGDRRRHGGRPSGAGHRSRSAGASQESHRTSHRLTGRLAKDDLIILPWEGPRSTIPMTVG